MRKLVVTEFLTLDDVVEDPHKWSFPYWNDSIAKLKYDELFASDALLLGRVTYEGFAATWPDRTDEQGYAEKMNSMPKYVVSSSLEKTDWQNSHIIKENILKEVLKLKQQPGKDILVHGSCQLVNALMRNNLVDEYTFLVYPVILGTGKRLFSDETQAKLKLVESKTFKTGVVLVRYRPAAEKEKS